MEKLTTLPKNSYWNETGAYQKEYNELYDKLVPAKGEAKTLHGELIRCGSRLVYEFYNNGNWNVMNDDGDGYVSINGFYEEMIDFIEETIKGDYVRRLRIFLLGESSCLNDEQEDKIYNDLMDNIMHFVLTTENKKI